MEASVSAASQPIITAKLVFIKISALAVSQLSFILKTTQSVCLAVHSMKDAKNAKASNSAPLARVTSTI